MIDLQQEAKNRLSPKRFKHVQGVVETAIVLAKRFGADVAKVSQAAWLHDMFRELTEWQLQTLLQEIKETIPLGPVATWHGPVCASRMERDFLVTDKDIQEAVKWHTVGHPDMGLVGEVLYVADAIEPGRAYEGVSLLREAAMVSLPLSVGVVADASLRYLLDRHWLIDTNTVALRNKAWRSVEREDREWFDRLHDH